MIDLSNENGVVVKVETDGTYSGKWNKGSYYAIDGGASAPTIVNIYKRISQPMDGNLPGGQPDFLVWSSAYTNFTINTVAPANAIAAAKLLNTFFFDAIGSSTNPNSGTYATLSAAITAQTAPLGYYLITDVADAGLLALVSQDANGVQFVETQAFGYFLNEIG